MSKASITLTLASAAKITDTIVNDIAQTCLEHAVATGDRAFQYHHFKDKSTIEVRVWPDGTYVVTETDPMGRPLPEPLPALVPRPETDSA